jgi:hypothetical protein
MLLHLAGIAVTCGGVSGTPPNGVLYIQNFLEKA